MLQPQRGCNNIQRSKWWHARFCDQGVAHGMILPRKEMSVQQRDQCGWPVGLGHKRVRVMGTAPIDMHPEDQGPLIQRRLVESLT